MESARPTDVVLILVVGMLSLSLLAGAVVLFFFLYQKRMLSHQLRISEMETAHREDLLHRNIEQVEAERHRIAADLHDELGGIFSTLKLKIRQLSTDPAQMAAVLSDSQSIIDTGINSVRRISHSMTPPGLEMFGLADALESLCQKNSTPQTYVRFDCAPNFSRLSPPQELGLYRIAQELLNNALRHAEATEIVILLALPQEGTALFEYRDNGKGFDLEILKSRRGLGMKNIEARANYLKAKIQWQTQPGEGLKVSITLP